MLVLERKGSEVFCNSKKLTIVAQSTKGEGKEVVKVEGLEGSNGQKWVSLSKLNEGSNNVETNAREVKSSAKYELTESEKIKVEKLQTQIDAIITTAKSRYIPKIDLNKIDPSKLTPEEKANLIIQLKKTLNIV